MCFGADEHATSGNIKIQSNDMMEFCSLSAQNVPEEQFKPEIEIKIRVVVLVVLGGEQNV